MAGCDEPLPTLAPPARSAGGEGAKGQSYRAAELLSYRVTELRSYEVTKSLRCKGAGLQGCRVAERLRPERSLGRRQW